MKVSASNHGDILGNSEPSLENFFNRTNCERIIIGENPIWNRPVPEQKAHCLCTHAFAVNIDPRAGHNQRFQVWHAVSLKCALISLVSPAPRAVLPAPDVRYRLASLINEVLGCELADGFVIRAHKIRRKPGQFTVNQNVRYLMSIQPRKGFDIAAG